MRARLLREPDLTLTKAIELSKSQLQNIVETHDKHVSALYAKKSPRNRGRPQVDSASESHTGWRAKTSSSSSAAVAAAAAVVYTSDKTSTRGMYKVWDEA